MKINENRENRGESYKNKSSKVERSNPIEWPLTEMDWKECREIQHKHKTVKKKQERKKM
jgi:hypothetical protein